MFTSTLASEQVSQYYLIPISEKGVFRALISQAQEPITDIKLYKHSSHPAQVHSLQQISIVVQSPHIFVELLLSSK